MRTKKAFPKSAIVYEGPSRFNDRRIVAIVTGLNGRSKNPKTGRMAQLWILVADTSPLAAIESGANYAVCCDCKLKPRPVQVKKKGKWVTKWVGPCYVMVGKAPTSIWLAYRRGAYPRLEPTIVGEFLLANNLPIRHGAYGEPTALPVWVLNDLTPAGVDHSGYTHQWDAPFVQEQYGHLLMASVDTPCELSAASAQNWRTFRTRSADSPLMPGEIMCPASDEMNHRTTCADCTLCDGMHGDNDRRKNIAIVVHGSAKMHFAPLFRRDSAGAIAAIAVNA